MSVMLVCFAVEEEARPFRRLAGNRADVRILVTGMGRKNAERSIRTALDREQASAVLSCGFAGALKPEWKTGTVLYEAESADELSSRLERAGAQPGRFLCVDRVAGTAAEKRELWQKTAADAVEMESEVIHKVCRAEKLPCATVRVILDTAAEDLPLDFNAVMTPELRLDPVQLAKALASAPGKIPALLRFQKQTRLAAEALARVLAAL